MEVGSSTIGLIELTPANVPGHSTGDRPLGPGISRDAPCVPTRVPLGSHREAAADRLHSVIVALPLRADSVRFRLGPAPIDQ